MTCANKPTFKQYPNFTLNAGGRPAHWLVLRHRHAFACFESGEQDLLGRTEFWRRGPLTSSLALERRSAAMPTWPEAGREPKAGIRGSSASWLALRPQTLSRPVDTRIQLAAQPFSRGQSGCSLSPVGSARTERSRRCASAEVKSSPRAPLATFHCHSAHRHTMAVGTATRIASLQREPALRAAASLDRSLRAKPRATPAPKRGKGPGVCLTTNSILPIPNDVGSP